MAEDESDLLNTFGTRQLLRAMPAPNNDTDQCSGLQNLNKNISNPET